MNPYMPIILELTAEFFLSGGGGGGEELILQRKASYQLGYCTCSTICDRIWENRPNRRFGQN